MKRFICGQDGFNLFTIFKKQRLGCQCPKASIIIRAADWRSAGRSGTVKLIILYGIGKVKDRNYLDSNDFIPILRTAIQIKVSNKLVAITG